MRRVLTLLCVALMSLTALADFTVTFNPSETQGTNSAANAQDQMELDGVTISGTKAALAASPYRFAAGSKATISSTVGNIKKVEFTCLGSYSQSYGPDQFYGDGYTCQSGSNVGTWQGDAESFSLNTASQVRCTQIVVTIAEETVEELVPPVFHPNGGEFSGSLEVTLTCATENAEICYFEGDPEGDWANWTYYNGPFYVNETKTYTAYSQKGGETSEYVTVTFTKVELTVEAPVFMPGSCSFNDRLDVALSCGTPGATIYYSLDNELWNEYSTPIPVTDDLTIYAKAKVGDIESEVVSATYTKLPATTIEVTFDGSVDTGTGSTTERTPYTVVKDPVTMYVSDGRLGADHYRVYSGADLYFESTGAAILKIEFNGMSGYTASNLSKAEGNEGTWTTGGNDGVWEGNAQTVAFKANGQARFTTIIVTLAGSEEPAFLRGDVNNSGDVTIADVTTLIDYLLSGDTTNINLAAADCNNNEDVTIADVTALIDYLLSGNWPD